MELKHQVLKVLEENRGISINGASLATQLGVTRSSIWKTVKALQNEGYLITAVTNKGYCLQQGNDIISAESLRPLLKGSAADFVLDIRPSVTSTNTVAKTLASEGAKEGTVVLAFEQTEGRGRMGRSFYSPSSTGIYMTIILRPDLSMADSLLITTGASVAVAKAIEKIAGVRAEIKWVNDIFVNGKKVCGILTEASIDFESGKLEYAVVGIGVNISTKDFPGTLKSTAGPVFDEKPGNTPISSKLAAEILNNLAEGMNSLMDKKYLEEYRSRSFLIGKEILIIEGTEQIPATAVGIDDKAGLIVEYEGGRTETLTCGEVSVRQI